MTEKEYSIQRSKTLYARNIVIEAVKSLNSLMKCMKQTYDTGMYDKTALRERLCDSEEKTSALQQVEDSDLNRASAVFFEVFFPDVVSLTEAAKTGAEGLQENRKNLKAVIQRMYSETAKIAEVLDVPGEHLISVYRKESGKITGFIRTAQKIEADEEEKEIFMRCIKEHSSVLASAVKKYISTNIYCHNVYDRCMKIAEKAELISGARTVQDYMQLKKEVSSQLNNIRRNLRKTFTETPAERTYRKYMYYDNR